MAEDAGRRAGDRRRGARAARAAGQGGRVSARARGHPRPRPLPAAARRRSARCCWPTSAPTSSRSRTPGWATTSAGRRRTTRARTTAAKSALFLALNRNKRSIRLNLKTDGGPRGVPAPGSRTPTSLLESFRPGVLDRLGVGYERLREDNPRLVYCAITGYGQDGPLRDRSGHDMNYLGLDRPARPDRRRGRPAGAGRRSDRRPRRRRADGRVRDPRRAARARPLRRGPARRRLDGRRRARRGWRWSRRARCTARRLPRRGSLQLGGAFVCYRPYRCADGCVTLGALEPKFWQAFCDGVGREDLLEQPSRRRAATAHRQVEAVFAARTRDEWTAFAGRARLLPGAGARARRGARLRARARARDGRRARPARRRRPVRLLGVAGQALAHARRPGPRSRSRARRAHREVLAEAGYERGRDRRAARAVRRGRRARREGVEGSFLA